MILCSPAETGWLQSPTGSPSLNAITSGVVTLPLKTRSTWKSRPPSTRSPVVPTSTIWSGPSAPIVGLNGGLQAAAPGGAARNTTAAPIAASSRFTGPA